jgi:hypothetical protein
MNLKRNKAHKNWIKDGTLFGALPIIPYNAKEKHPVVNQVWGNDDFKIQLSIYLERPLKAEEFAGIGEIALKIEELVVKLRQ